MANQPKTPLRAIRVDPELWDAAKRRAAQRDESVSDVIRRALQSYVDQAPIR